METGSAKNDLSSFDRYVSSVNVCNALALLVFQSNAADFVRRLAVLVRLKSCWTNGHDDVMVVCSASHKDDHEVSLLSETRTLVPCTYDLQRVKDGSSTADDGTVTLTTDVSGQPLDRKSVISKASSPLGSKSGDGDSSSTSFKQHTADDIVGDTSQLNEASSRCSSNSADAGAVASAECDDYVNLRHSYTVCGICCQRFSSYARLRTHLQKAHGVESPPGNAADAIDGSGSSSTAGDEGKTDNGAGFMCAVCGRQFRLRQLLTTHSVTHTGERPYACRHPGCTKRFGQSSTRNYHERTHSDARPYVCAQCGLGFKLQPILRNHVASVHGDAGGGSTQPAHRCQECGKAFKLAGALQTHVRTTHRADRPHACPDCPKRFKSRQQVERHRVSMHSDERPLSCPVCGRSFAQLCNMRTHMRTHTGERPFACSVCGSRFSHSGTLKGHMASHRKDNDLSQQLNGVDFDDMSFIAKMFD